MSRKKAMKNEAPDAGPEPGSLAAEPVAEAAPLPVYPGPMMPVAFDRDELFDLYVARVSTIDRYRIPITDKGLVSAYRKAYEEAELALKVYNDKMKEEIEP